jgi:hypothetical protein
VADSKKYSSPQGKKKLMERAGYSNWDDFVSDYDGEPVSGRWYFYGPERLSKEAKRIGYDVVSKDVVGKHDTTMSMIHLRKPVA